MKDNLSLWHRPASASADPKRFLLNACLILMSYAMFSSKLIRRFLLANPKDKDIVHTLAWMFSQISDERPLIAVYNHTLSPPFEPSTKASLHHSRPQCSISRPSTRIHDTRRNRLRHQYSRIHLTRSPPLPISFLLLPTLLPMLARPLEIHRQPTILFLLPFLFR